MLPHCGSATSRLTLALLLLVSALPAQAQSASTIVDHACVDAADTAIPRAALDKARKLNLLFGHQSVGGNILEGLSDLAGADPGRYGVEPVIDPEPSWYDANRGWGEFPIGENENPKSKIDQFRAKLVAEGFGKRLDVAMMKLCWVDFGEDAPGGKRTFEAYRSAMAAVAAACPKLTLVWWTAPLTTGADNAGRHEFNRLVREQCRAQKAWCFDLADIECHVPDGTAHAAGGAPALCPEYAEDEGHLNETGRRRAARAWWWLLARIAGWNGAPAGR
ncbi:MAG: hypothetical protein HZA54_09335 [Planctomycetes bacterium]|nr:hypothetical protein [Planctomycetota bacterium]